MNLSYSEWQPIIGLPKKAVIKSSSIIIEPIHFILIFIIALLFITSK